MNIIYVNVEERKAREQKGVRFVMPFLKEKINV